MVTITRSYPWTTSLAEVPDVVQNGVRYVPFAGSLITPSMVASRRALNERTPGTWSERACCAQFIVEFRAADSLAVTALGRAGR